jgi:hypothetical protein
MPHVNDWLNDAPCVCSPLGASSLRMALHNIHCSHRSARTLGLHRHVCPDMIKAITKNIQIFNKQTLSLQNVELRFRIRSVQFAQDIIVLRGQEYPTSVFFCLSQGFR